MPHSFAPAPKAHLITHISAWPVFPELRQEITLSFGNEVTALIGRNGVGKTWFLRHLLQTDPWPESEVICDEQPGYLPQVSVPPREASVAAHLAVDKALAAFERLQGGEGTPQDLEVLADRWDLPDRVAAALDRVGLQHVAADRPVRTLSGGEFARLELARLELSGARFLILDEPTNHLDSAARQNVLHFIETWPGGLLVATHDREVLAKAARILELSSLGARLHTGSYEGFLEIKAHEAAAATRELEQATRALRHVKQEARRETARAATRARAGKKFRREGGQPKSFLDFKTGKAEVSAGRRAQKTERLLSEKTAGVREAETRQERYQALAFQLPPSGAKPGRCLLRAEDVAFAYNDRRPFLLEGISAVLAGGDKLAVTGANGRGKTTLLKVLAGHLAPSRGVVARQSERLSYLDQHTELLEAHGTIMEAFLAHNRGSNAGQAHAALATFLFRNHDAQKSVRHLSGGERLRAALAILLYAPEPPQLLLLDEPSNHLDLDSQKAVAAALRSYDGGLIVVSHDEAFLKDIGVNKWLRV